MSLCLFHLHGHRERGPFFVCFTCTVTVSAGRRKSAARPALVRRSITGFSTWAGWKGLGSGSGLGSAPAPAVKGARGHGRAGVRLVARVFSASTATGYHGGARGRVTGEAAAASAATVLPVAADFTSVRSLSMAVAPAPE